jgi:hypothetical protein
MKSTLLFPFRKAKFSRRLSENEIFFSRSRKAKIITTPLKYSGTGIHTLKYFEDYNLRLTSRY